MDAIQLLLLSVTLFGVSALVSLLLNRFNRAARLTSCLMGIIASLVGLAAAIQAAIGHTSLFEFQIPLPFGHFALQMDGLSTLMVGMISLVSFAVSFYSISYLDQYSERNQGVLGFFMSLFVALMLLVVTIANAFYFLIFWEMMMLTSYFLVTF